MGPSHSKWLSAAIEQSVVSGACTTAIPLIPSRAGRFRGATANDDASQSYWESTRRVSYTRLPHRTRFPSPILNHHILSRTGSRLFKSIFACTPQHPLMLLPLSLFPQRLHVQVRMLLHFVAGLEWSFTNLPCHQSCILVAGVCKRRVQWPWAYEICGIYAEEEFGIHFLVWKDYADLTVVHEGKKHSSSPWTTSFRWPNLRVCHSTWDRTKESHLLLWARVSFGLMYLLLCRILNSLHEVRTVTGDMLVPSSPSWPVIRLSDSLAQFWL